MEGTQETADTDILPDVEAYLDMEWETDEFASSCEECSQESLTPTLPTYRGERRYNDDQDSDYIEDYDSDETVPPRPMTRSRVAMGLGSIDVVPLV